MISLRPATAADQKPIRAIVRTARLNPMSLRWPNFIVAVDEADGRIVGIGQIKLHDDGSRELASIAVLPAYQERGIARQIITALLARSTGRLYLTCLSGMGPFYEKFGFRGIGDDELTPYFRRLRRMAGLFERLMPADQHLLVMRRDEPGIADPQNL